MSVIVAVLSSFGFALIAPWIARRARDFSGWILAILPLCLTLYFATYMNSIARGEVVGYALSWVPSLGIQFSFHLDGLSLLFALLITGIGTLIVIYAGGYLAGHPQLGRFFTFIFLFMGSMLGLVLADNALTLFVFWELTSITSYLLIGFDHKKADSRYAALQALLVTATGGLALLAGLLLMGQASGSFELSEALKRGEIVRGHFLYEPILFLVLAGAFTKSAQFPFHFWLPNAMAAPTPVSAYLHSATMVKAGIYLLARLSPALGGTALWFGVVTTAGAVTMVLAAWMAFRQSDMKLLLAYSTVSALGLMTLLLGFNTPHAATALVVFLLGHALYKGALFLTAGLLDHETGTRDVTQLSGLRRVMPITATAACLGGLAMAGLPPFFGFFGKEMTYEALLAYDAGSLLIAAAVFTNMLFFAVAGVAVLKPFFGRKLAAPKHPHEAPPKLWLGPMILGALGLLLGLLPGLIDSPLLQSSGQAVLAQPVTLELALWHGLTPALFLSLVTFAGGALLYAWRDPLCRRAALFDRVQEWGPERWYAFFLNGLTVVAALQTRVLQSGYLRYYLLIIIGATVAAVSVPLARAGALDLTPAWTDIYFYELALAILILAAALTAVRTSSRLGAVAALGVVGYGIALIFILFGAPDVAMTQFLFETLMVILFVLVFYFLPRFTTLSPRPTRVRDAMIASLAGGLMTALVLVATSVQFHPPISEYFVENSVALTHGRNIVNVILVDFRALDTLGEITVLAIAGIGVFALLKLRLSKEKDS